MGMTTLVALVLTTGLALVGRAAGRVHIAFGGVDVVACFESTAECQAVGNESLAVGYTSLAKDGTQQWTTEFRFVTLNNMIAFENAPLRYLPKYGGFDPMQIVEKATYWSDDDLGPSVDIVGEWTVINGSGGTQEVYLFENASSSARFLKGYPDTKHAADAVWRNWFGSHGTGPPYAIAGGPFNTHCFTRVPTGSLVPAGEYCHHRKNTVLHRSNQEDGVLGLNGTANTYLRGIDVSHYQGSIDWGKVAKSGIKFACAKATEGTSYVDSTFQVNWAGMHKEGLTRCAYHFARPSSSPTAQAQHFVDTVNKAGGYQSSKTLQLMLDLEVTDGKSVADVWEWTKAFIAEIKSLTGRPGIIYTGYYFWRDSVDGSSNLDCPLWLASYTHPAPAGVPKAWSGWTFWQYDDNGASSPGGGPGSIPGIGGHSVDVDYFRYDEATLERFCFP